MVCQADAVSEEVSEEVRGESDASVLREYEMRALSAFETQAEIELRYNPYHDLKNGRFTLTKRKGIRTQRWLEGMR